MFAGLDNGDTPLVPFADEGYDCPTFAKFGACSCSTGVLGGTCPNTWTGGE